VIGVLEPLKDALGTIAKLPVLWLVGLAAGLLIAGDLLAQLYLDRFIVERLWVLQLIVLPLLIGGAYGVIRENDARLSTFLSQGTRNYFRILLPLLVVVFASIATMFLVFIPLILIGIPPELGTISYISLGVTIPIAFFAFFYDTAAIFEERKVFDSIRRSVEFVLRNAVPVAVFWVVSILILIGAGFPVLFLWTLLLMPKLEPMLGMSATEAQSLTAQELLALIGPEGIWITALLSLAYLTLMVTLLTAYKASLFRHHAGEQPPMQGEFDEKGRWYKY